MGLCACHFSLSGPRVRSVLATDRSAKNCPTAIARSKCPLEKCLPVFRFLPANFESSTRLRFHRQPIACPTSLDQALLFWIKPSFACGVDAVLEPVASLSILFLLVLFLFRFVPNKSSFLPMLAMPDDR